MRAISGNRWFRFCRTPDPCHTTRIFTDGVLPNRLPEFLPDALNTDVIVNALIVVCLFTGAYVAEIVRGGLQSVPPGQVEAARALGLGNVHTTVLIVLPQALRAVIPALVSQLISLWKDTTLFSILSFTDALGAAQASISQADFIGRQKEVLLFIGLAFWSVAFGMSRLSQRIERALGVGVR
ncbi:MAG: general L-amino acid transport system permease protein [Chloroflexi bacterium]|jgi:general L-amino acid transport system permease protein|nr:MAG: general L-amino acid transport system permease protein [Chloroflexota bacterium]